MSINENWLLKYEEVLSFDKEEDVVLFSVAFIMPGEGPVVELVEKDHMMDFMMLMYEASIPVSILGYCD